MANNFKPNDLNETIAVYPSAAPRELLASSGFRAPLENANLNPDRTALTFRTVRKHDHRELTKVALSAPRHFAYWIQVVPEALPAKAVNGRLRRCARRSGLKADASNSPPQASRRVETDRFIGHPLHSNCTAPSTFWTTHDKMRTILDFLRIRKVIEILDSENA